MMTNAASKGVRLNREGGAMLSTGSLRSACNLGNGPEKVEQDEFKDTSKWISALLPWNKGPISY